MNLDLPPARIDIGKLTYEYHLEDNKYNDARAFVIDKLKPKYDFEKVHIRAVVSEDWDIYWEKYNVRGC